MESILSVKGLVKGYGRTGYKTVAVHDVGFELHEGEILGIVGASGSGKSTLLHLISGLEAPDAGHICLDGRELSGRRSLADRRDVQMIFQDAVSSFHPRRTVERSIYDAFYSLMGRGAQLDLPALCREVGLDALLAQRYPRSLSGGQCQRFAIARALASEPRILLCDEITSALDVSSQAQILSLLSSLRRDKGMSIVFVSHDLAVVSSLCDRVLVMHGGTVVEEGTAEGIVSAPQSEYTKKLTASVLEI